MAVSISGAAAGQPVDEAKLHRLYIGGLAENVTDAELEQRFKTFGKIIGAQILKDRVTGTPRGFGYVSLQATEKDVAKCMTALNGAKWKGHALRIQRAKESTLTRLEQERKELEERESAASQAAAEAANEKRVMTTKMAKKAEGWRVAQNGRAVAIVRIKDPRRQRVITVDPSRDITTRLKRFHDRSEPVDRKTVLGYLFAESPSTPAVAKQPLAKQAQPARASGSVVRNVTANGVRGASNKMPGLSTMHVDSDSEPDAPPVKRIKATAPQDELPEIPIWQLLGLPSNHMDASPEGADLSSNDHSEDDLEQPANYSSGSNVEPSSPDNDEVELDASEDSDSEPELDASEDSNSEPEVDASEDSDSEPELLSRQPQQGLDGDTGEATIAAASAKSSGAIKKKGVSDEERRALANERRLQSLKELAEQRAKRAIKIDPDARGPQTNKLRFDDSEDEQEGESEANLRNNGSNAAKSLLSESEDEIEMKKRVQTVIATAKSKGSSDWLGLSDNESDNDAHRFEVKEVFQGEKGQKLLEMTKRFKADERFKLDSRFIEDESDGEELSSGEAAPLRPVAGDKEDAVKKQLQEEKARNLQIMAALLGRDPESLKPSAKESEQAGGKKRAVPQPLTHTHYDPTSADAAKFELQQDRAEKSDKRHKEEQRGESPPAMEDASQSHTKAPEVSKDKFFDVDMSTVSTLFHRRKTEDAPAPKYESFSLMGLLGAEDNDTDDAASARNDLVYESMSEAGSIDSEDDSDGPGGAEEQAPATMLAGAGATQHNGAKRMFFFHMSDPKLANRLVANSELKDDTIGHAAYAQFFMRTETDEELTERWKANREKLTKEFKSKHKTNIKRNRRTKDKGLPA